MAFVCVSFLTILTSCVYNTLSSLACFLPFSLLSLCFLSVYPVILYGQCRWFSLVLPATFVFAAFLFIYRSLNLACTWNLDIELLVQILWPFAVLCLYVGHRTEHISKGCSQNTLSQNKLVFSVIALVGTPYRSKMFQTFVSLFKSQINILDIFASQSKQEQKRTIGYFVINCSGFDYVVFSFCKQYSWKWKYCFIFSTIFVNCV